MNIHKIKSIWFSKEKKCILKKIVKNTENHDLKIKSKFSLISQGSERLVFNGQVPKSVMNDMRVPYQEGTFSFPCNYGYSLVGKILEGPGNLIGKHAHVLHPHSDYAFVNQNDITICPSEISLESCALISQIQTAITAIWDSQLDFGDRVLIIGFGLIGASIACLLKERSDIHIEVSDNHPTRCQFARDLGFNVATNQRTSTFDICYYCASTPDSLNQAMTQLKLEGKLIQTSWFGDQQMNTVLGSDFHTKRLQWISSQVSQIPSRLAQKWNFKSRNQLVLQCLKNPLFEKIPKNIIPFNDLAKHYPKSLIDSHLIQLISYE